jgi:formylglycine-generating enzyme required for sulfatase activity
MPERTWEQARYECRKIRKRLPSLSELQAAHKAGLGEIWGGTYL